ncbi:MAG: hypothetical protein ACRD1L_07065 [Terriglobales bacterium]
MTSFSFANNRTSGGSYHAEGLTGPRLCVGEGRVLVLLYDTDTHLAQRDRSGLGRDLAVVVSLDPGTLAVCDVLRTRIANAWNKQLMCPEGGQQYLVDSGDIYPLDVKLEIEAALPGVPKSQRGIIASMDGDLLATTAYETYGETYSVRRVGSAVEVAHLKPDVPAVKNKVGSWYEGVPDESDYLATNIVAGKLGTAMFSNPMVLGFGLAVDLTTGKFTWGAFSSRPSPTACGSTIFATDYSGLEALASPAWFAKLEVTTPGGTPYLYQIPFRGGGVFARQLPGGAGGWQRIPRAGVPGLRARSLRRAAGSLRPQHGREARLAREFVLARGTPPVARLRLCQ